MVEVQQSPLSAFHDDVFAFRQRVSDDVLGPAHIRRKGGRPSLRLFVNLFQVDGFSAVDFCNDLALVGDDVRQPHEQVLRVQQFTHPQPGTAHFVHVRRPHAPPCRADGVIAPPFFFQLVQRDVVRHYHVGAVADPQIAGQAGAARHLDLFDQDVGIDDHSVADHVHGVRPADAGWDEMKLERAELVDHGVAGVVTARVPCDDRRALGQEVNDLPFSFVAPLGAYDCVCGHGIGKRRAFRPGRRGDRAA